MRRIYRLAKSVLVFSLVFMMTVDTANACRLFQWLFAHRGAVSACCAADMGVELAAPGCCEPVVEVVDGCCVSSAPVVVEEAVAFPVVEPYVESEVYSAPVPVEETIWDASPVDVVPADTIVAPAEEEYVPTPAEPEPAPAPEADTTTPEATTPEAAPVAEEAEATPENPLENAADDGGYGGGGAVDEQPVEPADDGGLFDEPAAEPTAPADDGGLFDAPADDPAPADDGGFGGLDEPATPADDGGLFDEPAAEPTTPADDGGLFDAPAEDPAPADDGGLFDEPAAEPAPAGDADLFDAPADAGDGGDLFDAAPADDSGDDLFDGSAPTEAADDLDDLFSKTRPDGMRQWTDNTGEYQTVGRLVLIAKTHVRLLKENGRFTTVPLTRLSKGDLDYVMAVAVKLTQGERLASR